MTAAGERGADPEASARELCLRELTLGPRSRRQLERVLARADLPPDAASRVLGRLEEVGLVDDRVFAEDLIRTRHGGRGVGRRALSAELRSRGVDEETAAHALATLGADEERATALELARRKLARSRGVTREVRVRRVASLLARKGYSADLVTDVVRQSLAEQAAEDGCGDDRKDG